MKTICQIILFSLVACFAVNAEKNQKLKSNTMRVEYAQSKIDVDGKLDELIWTKARKYKLHRAANRSRGGANVSQPGEIMLAYDTNYFYVGIKFNDLDIIAEGKEDQLKHYKLGDICELILTPGNKTWYWEIYATPAGKKSCFFIPGRARVGLPSMLEYKSDLNVAANVNGTLNNWQDKDTNWTAEIAVPINELTARGESFGTNSNWKILVARYNFGRYIENEGAELNMIPQLSVENFHLINEFATLKFDK